MSSDLVHLVDRIAGAPITWGVCEVPSWGCQLEPGRVLGEMSALGLRATELGPRGFLPTDPERLREQLARHGLKLVGGFVPAVLHREDVVEEALAGVARSADLLAAGGAPVLVLAADCGESGYDASFEVDDAEWKTLVDTVDRVAELVEDRGMSVALHPHVGTVIEGPRDVERLLESSSVALCLDTGHLAVGGSDPVELARTAASRVAHVHLKDVRRDVAEQVRERRMSYHEGVSAGMYRPLGAGDLDIGGVVASLEREGYRGWYVLEQDTVIDEVPPEGEGPRLDAAASVEFLRRLAAGRDGRAPGRPAEERGAANAASLAEKGGGG